MFSVQRFMCNQAEFFCTKADIQAKLEAAAAVAQKIKEDTDKYVDDPKQRPGEDRLEVARRILHCHETKNNTLVVSDLNVTDVPSRSIVEAEIKELFIGNHNFPVETMAALKGIAYLEKEGGVSRVVSCPEKLGWGETCSMRINGHLKYTLTA